MGWILAKQIIMWDGQLSWMPGEVQYSIVSSARTLEPALHLNLSWPWNKSLNFLVSTSQSINRNVSNYHMNFGGECTQSIYQYWHKVKPKCQYHSQPFLPKH